jgi:hypothetical protein
VAAARSRATAATPEPPANILDAMTSELWWGPWFATGDWTAWRAFLAAAFGLPLPTGAADIFLACSGLCEAPVARAAETYAIVGRRGGKTKIMSLIAAYLAAFEDWRPFLSRGERAHVMLVSKDREQAGIAFSYLESLFLEHPHLKLLVKDSSAGLLELRNSVTVKVAAASFRGLRGYAVAALLADELAFWFDGDTSSNPAEEILRAIRPAMLQFKGRAMLLGCSSPFKRQGPLWEAYRDHHGKPGAILTWLASTETMHPLSPEERATIERERARDPEGAAAEYDCQWRDDISGFLDQALVDAAIDAGITLRMPKPGISYSMFIDPAGGRGDSFAATIGHTDEEGRIIQDWLYERKAPFSPTEVIAELEPWAKRYRIVRVMSDRYCEAVFTDALRAVGLLLEVNERTTSDTYMQALPRFADNVVRLLDDRRQANQLISLQRVTSASGKDTVRHPKNMHDDMAAACAGLIVLLASETVPALVRRELVVADGRLVDMPKWCRFLVGVMALSADKKLAAIAFLATRFDYGYNPGTVPAGTADDPAPATLVDVWEGGVADVGGVLFQRLEELHRATGAHDHFAIVPEECQTAFHVDGRAVETWQASWVTRELESLVLPVSGYIERGEFKIARHAAARGLPLGGVFSLRPGEKIGDDALQLAILVGLRLSLMDQRAVGMPIPWNAARVAFSP